MSCSERSVTDFVSTAIEAEAWRVIEDATILRPSLENQNGPDHGAVERSERRECAQAKDRPVVWPLVGSWDRGRTAQPG